MKGLQLAFLMLCSCAAVAAPDGGVVFSADFGRAGKDGVVATLPDGLVARFTNATLTVDVPLGDVSGRLELPARIFPKQDVKTACLAFDGTWWRLTCEGRTDEDSVRAPLEVDVRYRHEPFDFPAERDEKPFKIPGLRGWRPCAWNASVGDVACIAKDGVLHVFYLYDRRHHGSKGGAGGHFFAHLTTTNLVDWTEQPAAVPLREWWQSLGTGTPFVTKDGKLALAYGYHTERLPNAADKPVGATYAVADDDIHFRPSGEIIHTTRNPTVYNRPDGRYGMILGYQKDGGMFVSDDLKAWKPVDTKIPAHGDCPCYFVKDGHHYILQGFEPEFYLHSPTGRLGTWEEWSAKRRELTKGLKVPMVCEFRGRYLLLGWRPDSGAWWGGTLEIVELK